MDEKQVNSGLRLVSVLEAVKGLLVLLVGFGLLTYIHKDIHLAMEQLVRLFHLNPASRYPRIFLDLSEHISDGQLWVMALFALLYAGVRLVEAYGLWKQRQWAEWVGLVTGGMYVPIELYEIARGVTWPKTVLLLVNAGIVGYLSYVVYRSGQKDH